MGEKVYFETAAAARYRRIRCRISYPDRTPKALIVILHSALEHSGLYKDFEKAFENKSLSFNISSNANNKLYANDRSYFSLMDQIKNKGWNHVKFSLENYDVSKTDLTKVTYIYLNSSERNNSPNISSDEMRIANLCGTKTIIKVDDVYGDNMIFQQNEPFDIQMEYQL